MRNLILLFLCLAAIGFSNPKPDVCIPTLEETATYTLMSAGVANQVYLVTHSASEPRILKIFTRKSLEELNHSESLLQLVRNAGINVPDSIIPPSEIGSKVIAVLSFVEGQHIDDSHLPEAARLMAKLHSIEMPQIPTPGLKNYGRLFDRCKSWKYCEDLKEIFESLDLSYRDLLPRGLIHGDFSYTNLIVDCDNTLGLLDFDHLRNDLLLTDIARCHLFYGFDREGQLKEETIQAFVSAYNIVRPLTAVELDAFYTHLKLCLLDVALEMYDHMYLIKDLPIERVDGNPFNACLNPDLLAREILSIRNKSSLVLENRDSPSLFSGRVGLRKKFEMSDAN